MTTITVPLVPPSPNELRRKYRTPFAYKRLRETWEHSLQYCVGSAAAMFELRKHAKAGRVRVKITLFHPGEYDPDNLTGCVKPVLDALKNIGYIHDDSKEWLQLVPPEQRGTSSRWDRKTILEIEAI